MEAAFSGAFRDFGWDPDHPSNLDAGLDLAMVRRQAGAEIAVALDNWSSLRRAWARASVASPLRSLAAASHALDPDPWRDGLRAVLDRPADEAREALLRLADDEATLRRQPAASLVLLAQEIRALPDRDRSAAILRAAWSRFPGDFWIAHDLGTISGAHGRYNNPEEAVRFLTAAIAIRPGSSDAHFDLGRVLHNKGDLDGAEAECREAIRLKPDHSGAHLNLGVALRHKGDLDGALAEYREAIRLQPDDAGAHRNLGGALLGKGDLDGALAECREAIRLQPDLADAHSNLGGALQDKGDLDGALAEYREAIRLKPDHAGAHLNLGDALLDKRELDGAVAEYREAIRLKPDHAGAHNNLGQTLQAQGRYTEALAEIRTGHALGSRLPDWRYPSAQWVAEAERMVALSSRLPTVLRGEDRPRDPAEIFVLATIASQRSLYMGAARLYAGALDTNPKLAEDRTAQHAYNAACCAALAGCGRGKDDPPPDEAARAKLRAQALGWLREEASAWKRAALTAGDPDRPSVAPTLAHWKVDPDLAGVRDPDALAKLPEAERAAWKALWDHVEALRKKVAPIGR